MSLSVMMHKVKLGLMASAGAVVCLVPVNQAVAAPIYESLAHFSVGNWYQADPNDPDQWATNGVLYGPNQQGDISNTLAQAGISGTASFQGLDGNYDLATTTIDYSAQAQTSLSGGLKSSASISGSNAFWNDANAAYVNSDLSVDPNGVPAIYSVYGWSRVTDTLSVNGGPGLASVKFVFDIDGQLTATPGSGGGATISLNAWQTASTGYQSNYYAGVGWSDPNTSSLLVNQQVTSDFFNVVGGNVFLDLGLVAAADFGSFWGVDGEPSTGFVSDGTATSNFYSTVKIAQILGFDADGRQVSLFNVTGSDGSILPAMSLPVSAVPEPATWAMMITGFGLAGASLRRSRRALAAA